METNGKSERKRIVETVDTLAVDTYVNKKPLKRSRQLGFESTQGNFKSQVDTKRIHNFEKSYCLDEKVFNFFVVNSSQK